MNHQNIDRQDTLKALIEATVDGVVTIDIKGIIQYVNRSACILFGYEREELVGHSMNILVPEGIRHKHDGYIDNYLQTGKAKIIGIGREVIGIRKNGTQFSFWLSVNEIKVNDVTLFTGLIHDLSEQKRVEKALQELTYELEEEVSKRTNELSDVVNKLLKTNVRLQAEIKAKDESELALRNSEAMLKTSLDKEKELNRLKSRFLAMASHEFKTPLATILSSANLILRYENKNQQNERERHINKIKKSIKELNEILTDFLSVERMDGVDIQVEKKWFNLKEFCFSLAEDSQSILKHRQSINIDFNVKEEQFYQDPHILKICFRNLMSNASKYSPENAEINMLIKSTDKQCSISFVDQGIGISSHDRPYIFTRFFRGKNAENIKGTGLGLAIVKRYVELIGGTITFVSSKNKGSRFTINLPKEYGD